MKKIRTRGVCRPSSSCYSPAGCLGCGKGMGTQGPAHLLSSLVQDLLNHQKSGFDESKFELPVTSLWKSTPCKIGKLETWTLWEKDGKHHLFFLGAATKMVLVCNCKRDQRIQAQLRSIGEAQRGVEPASISCISWLGIVIDHDRSYLVVQEYGYMMIYDDSDPDPWKTTTTHVHFWLLGWLSSNVRRGS